MAEDYKEIVATKDISTALRAIKVHCLEVCCCGEREAWKECSIVDCPLHKYRLGKHPTHKGKGNTSNLVHSTHLIPKSS